MPTLSQELKEALARNIIKIDESAADGLGGAVENSLAYLVEEIDRHFHVRERWWGAVAAPDEDTTVVEVNVSRPFVAISGANTWGTAIPILGAADDVGIGADPYFDPHRLLFVDFNGNATAWRVRFIWGTGTSADAITAGQWSEIMVINAVAGPFAVGVPSDIKHVRIAVGLKMWAQVWNATNLEELDFFYGTHSYEG